MGDLVRANGNQAPKQLTAWENVSWGNVSDEEVARDTAHNGADVEERCGEGELVAVHVKIFLHSADIGIAEVGL